MMKELKIKDNSQIGKEVFSQFGNLTKNIADKSLEQLEEEGIFIFPEVLNDSEDLSKDQLILQSFNDTFLTGNVMGFIGIGDERLVIESRFSKKDKDYFFQYLLENVLDYPNIVSFDAESDKKDRFYNLLLFLFPYYLRNAMRKGLFKAYRRNSYNDDNVRGSIDIQRHIVRNSPFIGNIAYNQREYSFDNDITELIRHTIEFIRLKPIGKIILGRVKEEIKTVSYATSSYDFCDRQKVIEANKSNIIRHAFYREYRALQHLCLLILQNQKHNIGSGTRKIYGILFDGSWLWEEYINSLVEDIFFHPENRKKSDGQSLFFGGTGKIYPDFISRNSLRRVIGDAKYKPVENISNKDYLQVLAYMFRFDSKLGYYFYPESENNDDRHLILNTGSTFEKNVRPSEDIRVIKHGLKIPSDFYDYEDFKIKIRLSEKRFRECLEEE